MEFKLTIDKKYVIFQLLGKNHIILYGFCMDSESFMVQLSYFYSKIKNYYLNNFFATFIESDRFLLNICKLN